MIGFAGILLGMFSIGVMQLILATALPSIVADIGGSSLYSWVFSSYMLSSLAAIPLFSKLADIYGKKKFYILGSCIFVAGSIFGGMTNAMPHLIASRVIQGIGAGIITPVTMAMITDMFPPEKRGNMIGIFGFVQLLSNLLSPPLGSFITKQLQWRWIFFLAVVLIALSMLFVILGGPGRESRSSMRLSEIDISGGLAFGGFCVLTVGLSNVLGKEHSLGIYGILFLAGAIVLMFVLAVNERRHKNPVVKVEFLKNRIIRSSIISAILTRAIMYGLVTILPLCGSFLNKQGFNIDESRLLLIFMVGITTGMLAGSRISGKLKSGILTRILWAVMSTGSILMVYTIVSGRITVFYILNIIVGLCTGGIMATFLINSQNAVESGDRTVLSGFIQLARYFGASIGVTILTGMLPASLGISRIGEFTGAFVLLVVLCIAGLVNSILEQGKGTVTQ